MALTFLCGLREANAGLSLEVTETITLPVGDPLAQYDFKLSLVPGTEVIQGDNLTLLNVLNYSAASYQFTSGGIDYSNFFSIQTSQGTVPGATNVELVLTASPGSLINSSTTASLPVGDLYVTTTDEYPPPAGSPFYNPIAYTTQGHTFPGGVLDLGAGFTPAASIVPEPASWALLGVGIASGLAWSRSRRATGRA